MERLPGRSALKQFFVERSFPSEAVRCQSRGAASRADSSAGPAEPAYLERDCR